MIRITTLAALAAPALALAIGPASAAELGATDKPIKIAVNAWTGQNLSAHIAGRLLEKLGYKVEYVTAGAVPQLSAIAQGTLNLQPEFWDNNVGDIYEKAVEAGDIVKVDQLGLEPKEGWIYPPYMQAKCPGLPAAKSLIECAQAFATAETFPKGRLITYPADWGTRSKELVEAADLPFVPIAGGSEGAMVAELKSAYAAEEPILMMFWAPHWIFAELDFDWVDLPPPAENCDTDPAPGLYADKTGDCGFAQANIWKLTNKDFQETWPAAYELVEDLTLTNDEQNAMILEVDQKKRSVEEVADEWVEENRDRWQEWVSAAEG